MRWYFVLDFESTCFEGKRDHPSEIIEFPVVILDAKKGVIVDTFRRFVRPTENPELSAFCTKLTGIRQNDLAVAAELDVVLTDFDKWLKTKKQELGCQFRPQNTSTAIFVTWTDWDISQCLWNECKRKKLPVPSDMLNRIDLKALFKEWFALENPQRKWSGGLADALDAVGLKFEGRPHCGVDDAKNTARLLSHILSRTKLTSS
ncbi:3'-5' exoribonuclease 1 [Fasciolopsis buskii]|uniref:3'-5' exoribonuclease 1 n=1 Tax=Fasciolopsis buskii TaxID=27845 RepID=A0A8E0RK14_9TREM|nr:3'-5' exoribonuclease 1 [Fasciolopsis buski]